MVEKVCDMCGVRRTVKNDDGYIADFMVARGTIRQNHASTTLIGAELCGKCADKVKDVVAKTIAIGEGNSAEVFVCENKFSREYPI